MISSIAWVPAGAADPNPKKYEMSLVEEDLVRKLQEQSNLDGENKKPISRKKLPKIMMTTAMTTKRV